MASKLLEREQACKAVTRPGFGTEGRRIEVYANFYQMTFNDKITAYQYDIEIEPKCPKFLRRKLIHELAQKNRDTHFKKGLPVYDGNKNLYSAIDLKIPESAIQIPVQLPEQVDAKAKEYTIFIKYVAHIDMSCLTQVLKASPYGDIPHPCLQLSDIVIRHFPSLRFTVAGRSIYQPPAPGQSWGLSDNRNASVLELWTGAYTSVRPSNTGLVLNIDESHTAFYEEQPVLDFMMKSLNKQGQVSPNFQLQDAERKIVEKAIKFLRVTAKHQPHRRQYRVEKLTTNPVSRISFEVDGKTMSIAEYFKRNYNYQLKYPNLPCLHVSPKEKNTFIPMEVCDIVAGQRCMKKLTGNETAAMIKGTAKKPDVRRKGTDAQMQKLGLNKNQQGRSNDPYLQQFGLGVETQKGMMRVPARVIDAPKLNYGPQGPDPKKPDTLQTQGGVWDQRGKRFSDAKALKNWAIFNFQPQNQCTVQDMKDFTAALQNAAKGLGMMVADPKKVSYVSERNNGIENEVSRLIEMAKDAKNIDMIFCFLPRNSSGVYAHIKHVCENQHDISTQCVEPRNVKPPKPQTLGNILQKVNAKLGGVNQKMDALPAAQMFRGRPFIIMGADNAHAAQGEGNRPTVSALVTSMDRTCTRYATQIALQKTADGKKLCSPVIESLQNMVKNALVKFRQTAKVKPERLIFFRDGVSEGQFHHVMQFEVNAIKHACMELDVNFKPPITYIVCQKRHHTRLYPVDQKNADRSGNIQAGTVVDTAITSTTDFDFYLNSHQGIQGTNKPAKYHVLVDENTFGPDDLQKLTFNLCHLYARCTRSVSIPAPVYYAHLATDRARAHLSNDKYNFESSDGASSVGGTGGQHRPQQDIAKILQDVSPHDDTKNRMYWI